ncbi:sensor histidine kinase [Halodesulfurarchaeum sp.]|uniref:sensor histidine kinase n=1 Tax=Halodesulfurarchaeum sp. TaxID=1980530 RepID=UPI002FC36406
MAREGRDIGPTEPVALQNVVEKAWEVVADGLDGAELQFANGGTQLPSVRADDDRLSQLLENLLRNAVEHSGEDITVTVGALSDGFYVEDNGPGIPADERDAVFDPGYSTAEEGTGFGLSIVKQVAEAHGWDVRVTDGSANGARFEFSGVEFTAG